MAEPKVSSKMRKGIKACEIILGIKYKGKTFGDAQKFLDEHLSEIQGKDIRAYMEPSEKMWKAIGIIIKNSDEEFTGSTMLEASEFISENQQYLKMKGD